MELRAEGGRAVLVGPPEPFELPAALAHALDEWAEVAAAVCADGPADPATAELVSARGRQLAARLATASGTAVRYTDPVRRVLVHVPPQPAGVVAPSPAEPAHPRGDAEHPPGEAVQVATAGEPSATEEPATAEPTPWATGLTVSAIAATVMLFTVVALARGLGEVSWWLGTIALVVVTAGLAPSVWLARHTPLWRWISYGVAGGLALSWVVVLLSALGP